MDTAKPWYQSTAILALIAGGMMALGKALGLLPPEVTQDQLISFLIVFIPIVLGIFGRVTAKKQVTLTKGAADKINNPKL